MLKNVRLIIITLSVFLSFTTTAQVTPSPQMIEQFRQLPLAEQQRLAQQYGFDVSILQQGSQVSSADSQQNTPLLQQTRRQQQAQAADVAEAEKDPHKLERFGLKLFDADISTFAPVSAMPVPDNYILGANDQLLLQLFGKQSSQVTMIVARNGAVMIPDVGPVTVAGLSFQLAAQLITDRVRQAMIGVEAAVSMGQLRTINIFVTGEAKYPGAYAVSALTTVTQALFVAGGVSDIGSLREIKVNRAGNTIAHFDLYDLLLYGDNRNDVHLQHGDVVFIAPVNALAEVRGEVKRPAIYEIKATNTLSDLLAMAGGAKAGAYPKSAVLERFNQQNLRDLQNIDLTQADIQRLQVRAGDVLRIAATSPRVENQLILAGAVVRPGFYAFRNGMKVNDLVKSLWSDLLISVDLDYALIVREENNKGDIQLVQFNLGKAITEPGSSDNIRLQPRDKILVFHHANQQYQRNRLNDYLRQQMNNLLDNHTERQWLLGDVASKTFTDLTKTESPFLQIEHKALMPENLSAELTVEEQQFLLQEKLQVIFDTLFADIAHLELTPYLTRTELLYPVISKIRQQAKTNTELKLVSIIGDVKVPGDYPLAQHATITDLIAAAGGLNESAFVSRAELSRINGQTTNINGVDTQHLVIDLQNVLQGNADNTVLQSRDRLNIFSTPDWSTERVVTLEGEVRFPGVYAVSKGETLADVIKRAGGFTENAFKYAAVFTRAQIQKREAEQLRRLLEQLKADVATKALSAQTTNTAPENALFMVNELAKLTPQGRLVIDLEQIQAGNPQYNVAVEHGDKLFVPRRHSDITIMGEVQHAGTHRYDAKLDVRSYLNLAGGFRKRADESRVYVIRADGSVFIPTNSWFSVSKQQLQPGDTIIVPVDTEYRDNMTLWTQVTQIFYQTAVAIAALNSF